jgi:prevent-host-death family protein
MDTHSVAEARDQLSDLIDRAIAGETVVITRSGQPVVRLTSMVCKPAAPVSAADRAWLAGRRVGTIAPVEDAGELISRMRDEDEL